MMNSIWLAFFICLVAVIVLIVDLGVAMLISKLIVMANKHAGLDNDGNPTDNDREGN